MIIHDFSTTNSILNTFMFQLREKSRQLDAMRFRKNIERVGEILGYELSKMLQFKHHSFNTPLEELEMDVMEEKIVLCSVLRAGLPLHQGLLNYFDDAENAFISAYREHSANGEVSDVIVNYLASPSLEDKTLILSDPMLATGKTLENVRWAMRGLGEPKSIHIVSVIGSTTGVKHIKKIFPSNTHLWIGAIDDCLNDKGYIVPGLGDAGDLSFGVKL